MTWLIYSIGLFGAVVLGFGILLALLLWMRRLE